MRLTGREKATIFLSILGTDTSSRILRYLPEELADLIASSINHLPTPTPEALGEVLNDFQSYGALPTVKATPKFEVVEQETIRPGATPKEIIEGSTSRALAFVLSGERPQVTAFMLSLLSDKKKDAILAEIVSQKDIVSSLLGNIKKTPVSIKMEEKLINYFGEKLK
jgi:flagellar motor switch protein FliG